MYGSNGVFGQNKRCMTLLLQRFLPMRVMPTDVAPRLVEQGWTQAHQVGDDVVTALGMHRLVSRALLSSL